MNEDVSDSPDQLYAEKQASIQDFTFNEEVTRVFNDMVRRSVPGYDVVVELIGVLAAVHSRTVRRPLRCIDLGCSRGAVTNSLLGQLTDPTTQIVAIDTSEAMIRTARAEITDERATFLLQDIRTSNFDDVDIAVMNLVLQFIEPDERLSMLTKIRRGLRPDGLLILTEKVQSDDEFVDYHHSFKRAKGYTDLEITQKRDALEKVMVIDSIETHQNRLSEAGFSRITVWFQLLNWVSLIARP